MVVFLILYMYTLSVSVLFQVGIKGVRLSKYMSSFSFVRYGEYCSFTMKKF